MSASGVSGLPATMRAAIVQGPRELRVEQRDVPAPGPREALIRVSHCGICGTDLHLVWEGMAPRGSALGHEYSGELCALGSELEQEGWSLGDAVVGGPRSECQRCASCREGRPWLCSERPPLGGGDSDGAFAEYVRVDASQLLRIPEGLSLRTAALAEPVAVAQHAVTRSGVHAGQRALVTGAGPIGLLVTAVLQAQGVRDVVVSEPAPLRAKQAEQLGPARVLAPEALASPKLPFDRVPHPFDVAFECSGNPAAMEQALAQLTLGGTLVLVGTGMRRPRLDHNRVLLNELIVTGAYNYDANGMHKALDLLASGALPAELLIESSRVPLEGLQEAIERLAHAELAAKVMVTPREDEA